MMDALSLIGVMLALAATLITVFVVVWFLVGGDW